MSPTRGTPAMPVPAPPEHAAEPIFEGIVHTPADRALPLLRAGNTNCGGCGMSIALNMMSRAIADRPVQIVIPACCGIVTAGPFPYSAYGAPVVASTFAAAAAVATGLARVAESCGEATRILCFAGDGGTYDIGLATLSAAAERNEDILYVCYDNEIYGNTGGQRSSATPLGAATSTTPAGKHVEKKDMLAILAAHRVPYAASVSLAHPEDLMRKMRTALDLRGFRFLHILSPCPTGWKSEPADGIALIRLAVQSGLYPIVEIAGGDRWTINVEPTFAPEALKAFVDRQGRFAHDEATLHEVRRGIRRAWERLRARVASSPELPTSGAEGAPVGAA
ncbi:MAG TPA: thiamine pyrophosphate-dependent enzyme [Candidatus Binatia bacterium]|nr:thiamine pyrophosphate-dependent enzyme [Candidatus Binatia bacterium]